MKSRSFRFLISALAIAGFLFAACNKDELKPGIDTSLPGAEGLAYDETNGGDNMIALIWNSDKAIAAGATSFTVQLVTDLSQGGDIYSTMSQTFAVDPNGINNAVKFEGLKTGAQFYARARANYPGSRMSDWIYVTSSSDTSSPYLMTVTGKTTTLKAKLLKATSSTLSFQFTISDYLTGATDIAETYNAGIYKDKACTDLVVSWVLQNTATGQNAALKWTETDGARFVFAGLSPNTTYYMKVVDVTDSEKPIEAESVIEAKTLAFNPISLPTSTAAAGDVILAEDFSEFPWGGTLADNENCPGHSLLDRSTATALTAATGSNPVATEKGIGYYLCATGQNMGLFNTLGNAIPSTRLSNWGYHNEADASGIGALCAMPGCLQLGASSKTAQIVTPELNCLSGTATLTVSYDVQAESTDPNRDFFVDVITKSSISTYCVTYSDADCVNVADSVYNNNTTMTTKTIDIPNVQVGARLAFGGKRVPSTSGQQRFFFDNLIIKVKSYGSVHIDIATPVVTLTAGSDNIIASWDAANNAAAYVVEYKKSADADWTVAGSTAELTYKVTGLSPVTAYDVRVKAVSGESSSDYSAVVSATTTEAPKEVKQKAAMTSESQIGLNWSISDFSDVATDQGDAYTVGLYTDEACTDFKWQFNFGVNGLGEAYTSDNVVKNCFSWSSYLFTPGVVFSGLTPSTTYYVKVTDVTKSISSVAAYKTTASNIVDITKLTAGSATAGQTILDEDFSEFHFGGYSPAFLSGYSSGKRTSTAVMLDPTGTTPMADADKDLFNVAPATHMGLFNTLYSYIPSTRLAKWSTYVEANTLGAMCIEAGCLKIGASKKTGVIVTPPLSCLSGTATLEVSFDAAPYLEGDISKPDPLSMVVEVFPKDATIKAMTNGKTGTNLVTYGENWLDYTVAANAPTDVKELTLTTSPAMQHFTQTLTGVPAGAYIGIGAKISDKDASTSQHRMYLDNIHIKVVSY